MIAKLSAVLIALVLIFGSAAATASAAQESLPTDALYPVKTLGERFTLGLSVSSAAKLEKALDHAQRRVDEMAALTAIGVAVPEQVGDDYSERVAYALRLAARMSDEAMPQALEKIQQSLQKQQAALELLRAARPDDAQLAGVEWQLRQHMDLVAMGLGNPQIFREQLAVMLQGSDGPSSTQDPSVTEEPSVTVTPDPGDDNSNDGNTNDSNTNDDDVNGNDSNTNDDDANGNDDDSNTNDDDDNANDDDSNGNDDDSNGNDDDSNSNDDDSNGNDDDSNGNDDDGNTNDDDDSNGNDDDDSNGNGDDDSNGNGDDGSNKGRGGSGSSVSLTNFLVMLARTGGFPLSD